MQLPPAWPALTEGALPGSGRRHASYQLGARGASHRQRRVRSHTHLELYQVGGVTRDVRTSKGKGTGPSTSLTTGSLSPWTGVTSRHHTPNTPDANGHFGVGPAPKWQHRHHHRPGRASTRSPLSMAPSAHQVTSAPFKGPRSTLLTARPHGNPLRLL